MKSVYITQAKNGFAVNEIDLEKRTDMLHVASSRTELHAMIDAIYDGKAPAKDDSAKVVQLKERASGKSASKPTVVEPKAEGTVLDYEKDVKPVVLQLSRNPVLRPKLIEIYKGFGVSVGSELKVEQLPDALKAMKDALKQ